APATTPGWPAEPRPTPPARARRRHDEATAAGPAVVGHPPTSAAHPAVSMPATEPAAPPPAAVYVVGDAPARLRPYRGLPRPPGVLSCCPSGSPGAIAWFGERPIPR